MIKPTVAIDVQALQGPSAKRGIGRYVEHLSWHLLTDYSNQFDFRLIFSQNAPVPKELARQPWEKFPWHFLPIPPITWRGDIASALADSYQDLSVTADVALITSPFEGYLDSRTAAPYHAVTWARRTVVLAYDLIPLRLPNIYLTDPSFRAWYARQLALIAEAHHVLAISKATKLDLQELLHIPESKVSNISAATWDTVDPFQLDTTGQHLCIDITKPYFMYVYQPDHRKMPETLIDAFGRLPPRLKEHYQLVLVTKQDQHTAELQRSAHAAGIPDDALIVTGFIDDESLMSLYAQSIALVFPSLYEGFGLPVLEAIRCGTLVLASDSSSLPEVLGTPDTLFEPTDIAELTRLMTRAATDTVWRDAMRLRQAQHCERFSWESTAALAAKPLQELASQRQPIFVPKTEPVSITGPLPPTRSGIATYSASLLKVLRQRHRLEVVLKPGTVITDVFVEHNVKIRFSNEPLPPASRYIHHVGNQPMYHGYQLGLIAETGGVVVLHDVFLDHLSDFLPRIPTPTSLDRQMEQVPSATTVTDFTKAQKYREQRIGALLTWIADNAHHLVVHSEHAATTFKELAPSAKRQPTVIPLAQAVQLDALTKRSPHPRDRPLHIVCPGFVDESKSPFTVIRALALLKAERRSVVTFLGDADTHLARLIHDSSEKYGVPVTITGYVTDAEYHKVLSAADLCLVLRSFDRAETSAAALNALSLGIPTVVNDIGSFSELPSSAVIKVPPNNHTALSLALADLTSDPNAFTTLATNAAAYLQLNHNWELVASAYDDLIEHY